jgi:hypothetical protein
VHTYEVRRTKYGADLISEHLPFGKLRYGGPNAVENAIGYAEFFSRAHETEVRVHNETDAVVTVHRWDARTILDLLV